jgi:hypothetical protein
MASHYAAAVAAAANTATDDQAASLKAVVTGLVGYPCKIACMANDDWVDIYVFSEKKKAVTDWLELQSSGAIGVIFDSYKNPDAAAVLELSDRCDAYNAKADVEFVSDDEDSEDSDGSSEDSEGSEGGESEDGTSEVGKEKDEKK